MSQRWQWAKYVGGKRSVYHAYEKCTHSFEEASSLKTSYNYTFVLSLNFRGGIILHVGKLRPREVRFWNKASQQRRDPVLELRLSLPHF